ncbi:MAG: hypothetical protein ACXWMN_07040, partial [Candidatus Limnocylindria bacterium]
RWSIAFSSGVAFGSSRASMPKLSLAQARDDLCCEARSSNRTMFVSVPRTAVAEVEGYIGPTIGRSGHGVMAEFDASVRRGLHTAAEGKGPRDEFTRGESLAEGAFAAFHDGRVRDGFFKPEELQKLLKKVPSR